MNSLEPIYLRDPTQNAPSASLAPRATLPPSPYTSPTMPTLRSFTHGAPPAPLATTHRRPAIALGRLCAPAVLAAATPGGPGRATSSSPSPSSSKASSAGNILPHRLQPSTDTDSHAAQHAKRTKELRDRQAYLKNVWYAAALSQNVGTDPVKVQLCGKEMVLWRDQESGTLRCVDNVCPHRGAPLSGGWVEHRSADDGGSCVVCPYHGWQFDGQGVLRDVPAATETDKWPHRSLADAYPVEEKGGFVWLFFGSKALPAEERPLIPYTPELDDPSWRPVYAELEFEAPHFSVFENAIDMGHIHFLHGDSFGNQGAPQVIDMAASADATSVIATFKIHNKAPSPIWEPFQLPVVDVTAKAFLPSTSYVAFTLAAGLSFITFVNTVPISATKTINRFALVRRLTWDKSGLFNSPIWDGAARRAMLKILNEDKAMLEQLKADALPAEFSVRADLPQIEFRKIRQRWADMVGTVPVETERPPFCTSNKDM